MSYPVSPKLTETSIVRRFVSRGGNGYLSLSVYDGDALADAVPGTVKLKVYKRLTSTLSDDTVTDTRGDLVIDINDTTGVQYEDTGHYYYELGGELTSDRALFSAEWEYQVGDQTITFEDNLAVLDQMPAFDRLAPESKVMVESALWMFADLFDSTEGGPFLTEVFQSHFHPERLSHLLEIAVTKFNTTGYPITQFGLSRDDRSVPANMRGILVWGLRLEIIRHLIRSYVEIPNFTNMAVTYTDRRDYFQRWQAVLAEEKPEYEKATKMVKRSLLSLGRGSLLVAGGIFGGSGRGLFMPGLHASMVRGYRFYPSWPMASLSNSLSRGT